MEILKNGMANIFRVATTVLLSTLLSFNIFMLNAIRGDVKDIGGKMYSHLTNEEMHTLRGTVVTKNEFEMHRKFAEDNYNRISTDIDKLELNLKTELRDLYNRK